MKGELMPNHDSELSLAYLQAVLEASKGLIQSQSLHDALESTVRLSEQMLAADAFAVWQIVRPESEVRLLLSRGLSDSYLESTAVPLPDGMTVTEMIIPEVMKEPLLDTVRWRYESEGIRSLLVLPLTAGDADFGTLTLYYKSPHAFADAELTLARTLANLASAGIASAQLLEEQVENEKLLEEALLNQRKVEDRLRFLNRAGMILQESLEYEVTLTNLTRALVPEYADWCTVHLLRNGEISRVAIAHSDPEREKWAEELQERYPPDAEAEQGVHQVIRTGRPELVPEIPRDLLRQAARDAEHLQLIEEAGLKSYICVPLRTRSRVIGALTLVQAESGRSYRPEDLAVVEQVGWRAGLAVEKSMLFEESQRTLAEMELSNHAKDEFLGIVSHELRTPISTIYGSARLLNRAADRLTDEDKGELLRAIEEESDKMVRLVESLLMLARLEVGQALDQRLVAFRESIDKCMTPFLSAGRSVKLDVKTSREKVEADPTYLEHILTNLLSNADKYSPQETSIDLIVEDGDDGVLFRVLDQGPGVSPAELDLIFDSFYRSPRTSQLPGKGLGLAICKRLTEAQGGQIHARLRPTGGLEIAFSLPSPTPTP
jgi:signal transduction histidine kinase